MGNGAISPSIDRVYPLPWKGRPGLEGEESSPRELMAEFSAKWWRKDEV
jgi:hypothetical protein